MRALFLTVLNMNLTASYVIIIVILIRLLLKKAPKVISYSLWGIVAFRLIFPFSFESMFSLLPRNTNTTLIPNAIIFQQSPKINSGVEVVDSFISESLPTPTTRVSINPIKIYIEIGAYLWILGLMILLIYGFVSVLHLKRQLKCAQLLEKNIYEAKNLKTPFVLGFIQPKIYLPTGLGIEEKNYILLHEQTHIYRKDHIIKTFAFLILSLHWFNPLVWIAFKLMSMDMELSCDEYVMKKMKEDIKKPYANSLLLLATGEHILNGSPIAFGEGNVKGRIKNVLNYKKPRFWVVIASTILLISAGIALLSNPVSSDPDLSFLKPNNMLSLIAEQEQVKIVSSDYGNTFVTGSELAKWLDMADNQWKRKNVTSPYELSPSITIHVNDETGNEIRLYEFEPTLAMTLYQNEYRYYKIPKEDYLAIAAMTESGYFNTMYGNKLEQEQSSLEVESEQIIASAQLDNKNITLPQMTLVPTVYELSLEQSLGVAMPELDYASDDIVIFHGYFGLFVYDLDSFQIIRSLNLEPLNCNQTQGSNYCEVSVSMDGNTVQLHPMESKNMYIYTVSSHTLQESAYQPMAECFSIVPIEEIDSTKLGDYSYHAVRFDTGEYGYLHTSDWTLGSLSYVRGEMNYPLFGMMEDAVEVVDNGKRELWTKDGWTYYLEQIPRGGAIPRDNLAGRLFRKNKDDGIEILDELVRYEVGNSYNNNITVLPADDRIVFIGFAGTEVMDFKTVTIISIKEDGSDRRTYQPKFNVVRQLCYDNGYLYYEGWTNALAFPRPVCRINSDLSKDIKMADIDGSFITVHNGYAYYLNSSIYRLKLDWSSNPEIWDKAAIGKNVISVQRIADNEYNIVYDENRKPYILRLLDKK